MMPRVATLEDLPAVVKVIMAAINKERLWTNFVPSKSGQDQAYLDEIESLLKEHLDPSNRDWVIEVVDLASGNKGPSKIVAVAVWDMHAAIEGNKKSTASLLLLLLLAPLIQPTLSLTPTSVLHCFTTCDC